MPYESAARVTDGYVAPRFDATVDVGSYLRACPQNATTRGTYFQVVVAEVERLHPGASAGLLEDLSSHRWVSWNNYPLVDFMRLAVGATRILHSGLPVGEGLRRLGWLAYPSFAATMAGRVVLLAFGDDIESLMQVVAKAYTVSLSGTKISGERVAPECWNFSFRNVYNFPEFYHVGVFEGALRARGGTPRIGIRRHARPCDLDFEIRW